MGRWGERKLVPGSLSPSRRTDGHLPTCTLGCVFSFAVLGGRSCSSMRARKTVNSRPALAWEPEERCDSSRGWPSPARGQGTCHT